MRNSKRIKIVAGGTAALFGVGVAFAAWTSTGGDSASVTAGAAADLTVASVGSVDALYPGQSQDITVDVTNENPYPVKVSSVVSSPGDPDSVTGALGPACDITDVSIDPDPSAGEVLAAKGEAGDSTTYTFSVSMADDAESDCQGATFIYDFLATADSDVS